MCECVYCQIAVAFEMSFTCTNALGTAEDVKLKNNNTGPNKIVTADMNTLVSALGKMSTTPLLATHATLNLRRPADIFIPEPLPDLEYSEASGDDSGSHQLRFGGCRRNCSFVSDSGDDSELEVLDPPPSFK